MNNASFREPKNTILGSLAQGLVAEITTGSYGARIILVSRKYEVLQI